MMTSSKPVKIILGTHIVGDKQQNPGICHFDSRAEVDDLLNTFYERGYCELDTSRLYPGSEERLGRSNASSRFTIHTKVQSGQPGDHESAKIQSSIEQSLKDLQTSSVTTMFLHLPDRQTPFEETAKAMNDAIQKGKFQNFGLSNFSAAEVEKYIEICEQNGYSKPTVYQGHYNALVRGGEEELFPLLRKHGMAFFAYSPAAGGFFSGKPTSTARWTSDNIIGSLYNSLYGHVSVQATAERVQELVKKYGIDGHAAALRWTAFHSMLDGKSGDGIIFSVSKMEQMSKTLDAVANGPLPDELAEAITAIYATVKGNEPPYHM